MSHLISNIEAYGPDLIPLVRGIYGAGDDNTYPQSVCSYLQDMLKARYWADEIVLRAISIMFNITITVIRAETVLEVRVRAQQTPGRYRHSAYLDKFWAVLLVSVYTISTSHPYFRCSSNHFLMLVPFISITVSKMT